MEKKTGALVSVLILAMLTLGIASAYSVSNVPSGRWDSHYQEMAELHAAYYNNEISSQEFLEGMYQEMQEGDMPCLYGSGYAGQNMMGRYGMGQYGPGQYGMGMMGFGMMW